MTDLFQADADACGSLDAIRQWFAERDDGEFSMPPRRTPYLAIPPSPSSKYVLYTTKPQSVLALFSYGSSDFPCGVIGRCGLPNERPRAADSLTFNVRIQTLSEPRNALAP